MQIPHIKYIEALVVSKLPSHKIIENLEAYELECNKEAIAVIINTLRREKADYFKGENPEPADPDWIRELDIIEMYSHLTDFVVDEKALSVKKAFVLLSDPMMYRIITSLAFALITDEDIDLLVNGKFNREYSADDIKMFLKYFFDLTGWTLQDRQTYVNQVEDPQLGYFYKTALKKDKPYLLWKLGVAPEQDYGGMLKDMMNDAYYNFKEHSREKPEVAQKWGQLALKLTEKLNEYEQEKTETAGGADFLANFEFKIKTTASDVEQKEEDVPHLKDLK